MKLHPCICIPSSGIVKARFAVSLAGLMSYLAEHRLSQLHDEQQVDLFLLESSNIAENRVRLVQKTLEAGGTHVVFIDDDMSFPHDILHTMINRNVPFAACNYPYRCPHKGFTAGDLQGKPLITDAHSTGLVDALWSGFGFSVIRAEVFNAISQPWFVNAWTGDRFTTEDIPFCAKLREAGYRVLVDQDASRYVKHGGMYEYSWDDPIIQPDESLCTP